MLYGIYSSTSIQYKLTLESNTNNIDKSTASTSKIKDFGKAKELLVSKFSDHNDHLSEGDMEKWNELLFQEESRILT